VGALRPGHSTREFGPIGVTFVLASWRLILSMLVVVGTVSGAAIVTHREASREHPAGPADLVRQPRVKGAGKAGSKQPRCSSALVELRALATAIMSRACRRGHAPFAVLNRTANPVVRALLSSPLHPLLSRGLAMITVTGRRSGHRYTFPVGYRPDGDGVTVNGGWPQRKDWWRNLRQEARVEMRIRGRHRVGEAHAHGDERTGVTVEVQLDPNLGG
jgi:deazaflavin-dependent oxidoreductase (nitroreductase family)